MGLFDKVFGGDKNVDKENTPKKVNNVPWNDLTSESQLDEILSASEDKTVVVLKHSTRCGISRMVLKNFETEYSLTDTDPVELYFLDLLKHRDISNAIAEKFKVMHESPQLIVLKNREVVHHASHQAISAATLKDLL